MVSTGTRYAVRWKRAGVVSRLSILLLGAVLLSLLVYWQRPLNDEAYLQSNLAVFVLINLNIAILCVLIFLVGRNIAKLIFDRRKGILGSKLRMRLVLAFVGLTLIPSVVLVFVSSGLLSRAMEGWFSSPAGQSVAGALEVAKIYYDDLERSVEKKVRRISLELQSQQLDLSVKPLLKEYLGKRRSEEQLYAIQLFTEQQDVYVEVYNAAANIDHFRVPDPNPKELQAAWEGEQVTRFLKTEVSQFVRVYSPIVVGAQQLVMLSTYRVRPEVVYALDTVSSSYNEYEQLKRFRNPLKSVYILTLYMFTGLILFAAIWFGFYIARELTVPLQRLAEGTDEVAKGNYNVFIRQVGDDEISYLIQSFNRMTHDLSQTRDQAERRRVYIETILENLAVAVIGLDKEQRITSLNGAALHLFELRSEDSLRGKSLQAVLKQDVYEQVAPLIKGVVVAGAKKNAEREQELDIVSHGQERKVLCTLGILGDDLDSHRGIILLFDDITVLSQEQKMAAWREAARRIAHEIKNPLTPIRLAAQRLGKHAESEEHVSNDIIKDSVATIVEHTDSIKVLADEFSRFAKQTDMQFESLDINVLLSEVISLYSEECPDIVLQFIADARLPKVMVDREQIRRVIVNLLDNAVAALRGKDHTGETKAQRDARIILRTRYQKRSKKVFIEVSDNGPGVGDAQKTRIFQPYFTETKGGTGLGLAIVTSLIADHQGDIRVYDNEPQGAKFIVELPLVPVQSTQRRLHAVES